MNSYLQSKPRAALTDFDTSSRIDTPNTDHLAMTPHYACPSIFSSLLDQYRGQKGLFTTLSDLFALGRTVECDVVSSLLTEYAFLNDLSDDISVRNMHHCTFQKTIDGPFEEEKIADYERENPHRCLLSEQNLKLHIYETVEKRMEAFHTVLDLFAAKNILSANEIEVLTTLIEFALNSLQNPDLNKRKGLEETLDLTNRLSLICGQSSLKRPTENTIIMNQQTKIPRIDDDKGNVPYKKRNAFH